MNIGQHQKRRRECKDHGKSEVGLLIRMVHRLHVQAICFLFSVGLKEVVEILFLEKAMKLSFIPFTFLIVSMPAPFHLSISQTSVLLICQQRDRCVQSSQYPVWYSINNCGVLD